MRKQGMWRMSVVVFIVLAIFWLAACAGGPKDNPPVVGETVDGEAMLQESCTKCHGLDRVTAAQKTLDEWTQTVERMIQKGAQVADKEVLLVHLAETYGP